MSWLSSSTLIFFDLLKVGLWGNGNPDIRIDETTDWIYIYHLAQEQSVQGIVLQGIEELRAKGVKLSVPKVLLLQWIGEVQMIEQRNLEMNDFIAKLIKLLRKNGVYTLLVKGQGIAQCYERPLWRASGDIDLLVSKQDYLKVNQYLERISEEKVKESEPSKERLHQGFHVKGWLVEVHGTLHGHISKRIDSIIDKLQYDCLTNGSVRTWKNNGIDVFLPSVNNDVIFVFSHILQHLYREGIGLRQICDWCRLLWTCREDVDINRLEQCLEEMSILSEWKTFASLAVVYLGMPQDEMPLYDHVYDKKAYRILSIVIENGNFGQNINRDYVKNSSASVRRIKTLWVQTKASLKLALTFPLNSLLSWFNYCKDGAKSILATNKIT